MRSRSVCVMLAFAAACGGGATTGPRAPVTNQAVEAAAPARPRLSLDGALAMMPRGADLVLELDVKRLRASVLWERIEPWLRRQGGASLDEVARVCSFDPIASLDTLLLGASGLGQPDPDMTLFVRGYERRAVVACVEAAARTARDEGDDKAVVTDGDYVELREDGAPSLAFAFVDDRTALVVSHDDDLASRAALAAARGRTPEDGLTGSATVREVVARVDTRATAWLVMNGRSPLFAAMPFPLRALRAELHTSADPARALVGTVVFEMAGGDADAMAGMVTLGLDSLRGGPYDDLARALAVHVDGVEVVVELRFDLAQLERIGALLGPLVP